MKLRTYHAYSMNEALTAVKSDLGANAVILHTRTFTRARWFGMWRRTIVEVTATPSEAPRTGVSAAQTKHREEHAVAKSVRLKLRHDSAQRAYGSGLQKATSNSDEPNRLVAETAMAPDCAVRTRHLAMALAETHARQTPPSIAPGRESASGGECVQSPEIKGTKAFSTPDAFGVLKSDDRKTSGPVSRAARRFILTSPEEKPTSTSPPVMDANSGARVIVSDETNATSRSILTPAVHDELSAIRRMVGEVLHKQHVAASHAGTNVSADSTPKHLFDLYLKLIAQDMSEELADQIVNEVRSELGESEINDEQAVRTAVRRHLAAFIPCCPSDGLGDGVSVIPDGRPLTLALIGPTGVGKTTTIAKLAATFKLRQGKSVGLITADTYRIAAVDQLRTYAEIIDVPLHVACTPAEMKRAVAALSDRDVILIDTAGRSQKDASRLAELRRFLNAAQPHEIHLVLSGTAGERTLLEEAGAFSPLGVHKIVLTKLDEAVSFGMLISALRQIGMALSFVTTGQEVPDDIEPGLGVTDHLAALALGEAKHEIEPSRSMGTPHARFTADI